MAEETIQNRLLYAIGDACLTLTELSDHLKLDRSSIGQAAALLIQRGYVERIERGCFQATSAGAEAIRQGVRIESGVTGPDRATRPPKHNSIRQRAWNAMKIARTFTISEIAAVVAGPADGDVTENLRRYFCGLTKGGYLTKARRRRAGTAPGSNGFLVYQLERNTGPRAPVVSQKHGTIVDFNEGAK